MSVQVTNQMLEEWLPVVIADLELFKKPVTDHSIKASLYHRVILDMYDEQNFLHHEDEPPQVGCYIKGYVRDVWEYLGNAYDLIHGRDFSKASSPQTKEKGNRI